MVSGPQGPKTRKNTWFLASKPPRGGPGTKMARNSIQNCWFGVPFRGPPRLWTFVKKAVSAFLPIPGSAHSEWGFPTSVTTKYVPIPGSARSEWGFLTSDIAKGPTYVPKNVFLRGFRFLKALPRPWKRQAARNLRAFGVSVEFLHCLGCFFRHCLGLGSAKRLVIYVLWVPPLKNTSLEGLFLSLPRPWKRQKARNLHAFSGPRQKRFV